MQNTIHQIVLTFLRDDSWNFDKILNVIKKLTFMFFFL